MVMLLTSKLGRPRKQTISKIESLGSAKRQKLANSKNSKVLLTIRMLRFKMKKRVVIMMKVTFSRRRTSERCQIKILRLLWQRDK